MAALGQAGSVIPPHLYWREDLRDTPISGQVVQDAVVRHALGAGLGAKHYGGHSLRAGFVTSALQKGLSPHQIMRQSWHTTERRLEIYSREDAPLDNNAVTLIGL